MNPKFIPTAPPVTEAVRAECSKELLKRLDKFTNDRGELVARCDAFAAEVETARVDEGIDAENEIVTGQLKARKIMLLKSALALRQELAELLNDLEKPAHKAWDAAMAEIPKVETELFDALVKLGYTDSRLPEFSLDPSRVAEAIIGEEVCSDESPDEFWNAAIGDSESALRQRCDDDFVRGFAEGALKAFVEVKDSL